MASMMQPQIILLKEGTDTSQGKAQLVSNINACTAVGDVVRTTLGPRGMDKLIHDDKGSVTISNDGATIMKLLDIVHPAAKILVDIAKSQDSEVGDGTTTVVLLAAEFLKEAKPFIEDGVHAQNLIRSYRTASTLAIAKVKELAVSIEGKSVEEKKGLLAKCAATTLSSKLIGGEKEFFATMVVDAVMAIGNDDRLNLIGIKKVPGGNMRDSFLVDGVAFKKTFSYAGFEQQPKKFLNPKILLLNIELELKSEKENAEIRLSDPSQYQSIVDAEWNIIYDKLDKCVESGAKVVLSRLAIGDLATQYFADRDIFCAGRVAEEDLNRVAAAAGGTVQTSVNNIIDEVLGTCEIFEENKLVGRDLIYSVVALLTLTGDGEHRFHPDTIATILSLLEQAKSQSTRGSILITTANGKFFSNGFDLAWAQTAGSKTGAANRLHQMVESFKPVVAALLDLPMPTIAALNGHAAAAGLILALSHDYVFMRKDRGVLYMSEVDIGLSMPDYFSALVRAKIGTSAARRELLLSGKKIRGEEAVGLGIVDSAAYDSEEGVVVASVRLGEKLAAKKWSGEVYASIRKSLYPELCGILGLETRVFATPKL